MNPYVPKLQSVMAGMGLAFTSAHTVAPELAAKKLSILDVEGMPVLREWYVLHPKDTIMGLTTRKFRNYVERDGPGFKEEFFPPNFSRSSMVRLIP